VRKTGAVNETESQGKRGGGRKPVRNVRDGPEVYPERYGNKGYSLENKKACLFRLCLAGEGQFSFSVELFSMEVSSILGMQYFYEGEGTKVSGRWGGKLCLFTSRGKKLSGEKQTRRAK